MRRVLIDDIVVFNVAVSHPSQRGLRYSFVAFIEIFVMVLLLALGLAVGLCLFHAD